MSGRVLILTAGFGEGHNAAARSLAAAFDARQGPGAARVADVFALAGPRGNALARRSYLGLINRAPWLWRAAYGWMHRSALLPGLLRSLRRERHVLARLLAEEAPVAVCSTYPVYAYLLQALARERPLGVPCFSVVTDSISINSVWWRAGADGWFVPNDESAAVMREAGVDERRLQVAGFPVPAFFAAHENELAPPDLAAGANPRVLYIINSRTPAAEDTARLLLQETGWDVTCTVGRNRRLQRELEELASSRSAGTRILGWTDEIPRLLMTHHVVISKAGGATTQEALAARCPMIVNQIVPGQEEGNYELLRRHGIGALALTPSAVKWELQGAFAHGGRGWRHWRRALEPLARPRAAADIAAAVLAGSGSFATEEPIPLPHRAAAASA
ncbi:MAG: galactosyldiacylglycerol synthase [Opitutaceae bacterium]|nr:galactosyldiacylglycerol synthase [Opitutaceae bacterium]